MTESFEFKELRTELNICGQLVTLLINDKTAQICNEILCEARRRLALIKAGEKDTCISESEICTFFSESIERILGKGMVGEIFKERPQQLDDLADLLCYVAMEIRKVYEAQNRKLKQENK